MFLPFFLGKVDSRKREEGRGKRGSNYRYGTLQKIPLQLGYHTKFLFIFRYVDSEGGDGGGVSDHIF